MKIKSTINRFALWLWCKTHVITATEIMMMEEAKKPRLCEHCRLSTIHFLDDCECKHYEISVITKNL